MQGYAEKCDRLTLQIENKWSTAQCYPVTGKDVSNTILSALKHIELKNSVTKQPCF